jgi:predicted regulator of Ras-like GTPase activity (Roadblock/LC7/MglB family)
MTDDIFQAALERLSRVPGVRGALIVDADAGVPVVSELAADVDGGALAALAASLFKRTDRAVAAAMFGKLSTLQLEAEQGHVIAGDAGDLIIVAIAERQAQLGLVRLEVHRTAEGLR